MTATKKLDYEIREKSEILVVGAGPAGIGAALTAARTGAQVTLLEYGGVPGGMWTLGLLSPFFDNAGKGGLNRELREKLIERNAWGGLWNIAFDPTEMTMLLDEELLKQNIRIFFGTTVVDAIVEDGTIRGVIAANKSGLQAFPAKIVIDCTGDGDIAYHAGNPFEQGRAADGFTQPMTMMFRIGGLRSDYPKDYLRLWYDELIKRIPEEDLCRDVPFRNPALIRLPRNGEALLEWTHVYSRNGTNADELSAAMLEGRCQVRAAMRALKEIPDIIGNVFLLETPMIIGVRETRRITGDYVITDNDVKYGKKFDDGICRVHFNVDIHEPEQSHESQCLINHPGFDIPYRALLPSETDNLLVAGRCISGSHTAHAAYRVTGDCLATGEAAGLAAAMALSQEVTPRMLDGVVLSSELKKLREEYDESNS